MFSFLCELILRPDSQDSVDLCVCEDHIHPGLTVDRLLVSHSAFSVPARLRGWREVKSKAKSKATYRSVRSKRLLLRRVVEEGGYVGLELRQVCFVQVHHVAGVVILQVDVLLQVFRQT